MPKDISKTKTQLIEELTSLRQEITSFKVKGSMWVSAEQALRDGQTQLERIMSSAMDAIISVDEDQHILFFNSSAEVMFRCPATTALRQPLERFIPERFRHTHRHHVEAFGDRHVTNRKMGQLGIVYGLRTDGTEFPLEAGISHVEMSGRKIFTVILRDITERKIAEDIVKKHEQTLIHNQEELRALTAQLLTVQDEERRRVSRDLHDDVNQRLAALAVWIQTYQKTCDAAGQDTQPIQSLHQQVVTLSDDIRRLAYQLHPSILDDLGLPIALRSWATDFSQREPLVVSLVTRNLPESIAQPIAACLYRIAQEGIRNVAKHAKVTQALLLLSGTNQGIGLCVADFGNGFDPAEARKRRKGLGLASMEERVRLVGGNFKIKSQRGRGTHIHVLVPHSR
jgi:PAS domain S-box-containing protein